MKLPAGQTAFLFPGQGSQAVGMGRELAALFPSAAQVFAQGDEALGFPLSDLAWNGPEGDLNDTLNTQPALYAHSAAVLSVFQERFPDFKPAFVAGHSMGELSALLAAGAVPFADGLLLVRKRGALMKQAGTVFPGGMAAIVGLDIPTLDQVCEGATQRAREDQLTGEPEYIVVQVANDNCPGQVVISGSRAALEFAISMAQAAGARRAIPLAVSIAAHSPLMNPAQQEFNQAVATAHITDPHIPVVGNVTAAPLTTAGQIRADLQDQLTHRVRWTETIQYLRSQNITHFVELGSGSVLTGLVKRIDREAITLNLSKPEDFEDLSV